jgi:hypothetical protein
MKLNILKEILNEINTIRFILPNGSMVPIHFHVTEVGLIEKRFIDCGGTLRNEQFVNFQLWEADDFDHRLAPQKLRSIIELAEKELKLPDAEIEVEYQGETIGKYGLAFNGISFLLTNKQTACLAEDACGIPDQKQRIKLSDLSNKTSCCDPKSGCC